MTCNEQTRAGCPARGGRAYALLRLLAEPRAQGETLSPRLIGERVRTRPVARRWHTGWLRSVLCVRCVRPVVVGWVLRSRSSFAFVPAFGNMYRAFGRVRFCAFGPCVPSSRAARELRDVRSAMCRTIHTAMDRTILSYV